MKNTLYVNADPVSRISLSAGSVTGPRWRIHCFDTKCVLLLLI